MNEIGIRSGSRIQGCIEGTHKRLNELRYYVTNLSLCFETEYTWTDYGSTLF